MRWTRVAQCAIAACVAIIAGLRAAIAQPAPGRHDPAPVPASSAAPAAPASAAGSAGPAAPASAAAAPATTTAPASVAGSAGPAAPASAAAAPATTAAPAGTADPAASGVDPRSDAAWQLYHDVFGALMHGESARARDLAGALLRDHPDHPATRLVRGAHLGLAPGAVNEPGATERRVPETPSRGARAELALFQSLHGVALGIELCVVDRCDSAQSILGITLLGGAVGAVVPLAVGDLTSGERALLNSGTVWGAVNAGLLVAATEPGEAKSIALTLIGGQLAGLAAGRALFVVHPTAGQVALANSGGEWAGVLTELAVAASGAHPDGHSHAVLALIAIDAGIATGGYLASRYPQISRAQTLVIDAGGIVGAVGGGGLWVILSGQVDDRSTPALAAVGAAAGLAAAAYFTRDWSDAGTSSLHTYLAPPEHGRGGVAGIGFRW